MKAASAGRLLGPEDAAIFETSVVPSYLSLFAEQLVEMIVPARDARVVHLQCRTGYPDRLLHGPLPDAHVYGCDESEPAIELARAKVEAQPGFVADYRVVEGHVTPFPEAAFSHGFAIHPASAPLDRRAVLDELARIVAPRGQALVAMPLRGSFAEVADLLRECALKHELNDLMMAVETMTQLRPTEETLRKELETAGFDHVVVDTLPRSLRFASGRALLEDPAARLLWLPELRASLGLTDERPLTYVRDAIDKYWSEGTFELTLHVGVVSGRRRS
ncbi:MAG: Biotin synthesis protein BioC [Labilithrix sp.]|nr:Biotin synthesis protein BioC [Labilithrix sp.]